MPNPLEYKVEKVLNPKFSEKKLEDFTNEELAATICTILPLGFLYGCNALMICDQLVRYKRGASIEDFPLNEDYKLKPGKKLDRLLFFDYKFYSKYMENPYNKEIKEKMSDIIIIKKDDARIFLAKKYDLSLSE